MQDSVREAMRNRLLHHDELQIIGSGTVQKASGLKEGRNSILFYLEGLAESLSDRIPDNSELHLLLFQKRQAYDQFVE